MNSPWLASAAKAALRKLPLASLPTANLWVSTSFRSNFEISLNIVFSDHFYLVVRVLRRSFHFLYPRLVNMIVSSIVVAAVAAAAAAADVITRVFYMTRVGLPYVHCAPPILSIRASR